MKAIKEKNTDDKIDGSYLFSMNESGIYECIAKVTQPPHLMSVIVDNDLNAYNKCSEENLEMLGLDKKDLQELIKEKDNYNG